MNSLTSWNDFHSTKSQTLKNSSERMFTEKFDSYKETEKAWIIMKGSDKYILPKSKTILSKEDKTINIPSWLYVKVFTEKDDLPF